MLDVRCVRLGDSHIRGRAQNQVVAQFTATNDELNTKQDSLLEVIEQLKAEKQKLLAEFAAQSEELRLRHNADVKEWEMEVQRLNNELQGLQDFKRERVRDVLGSVFRDPGHEPRSHQGLTVLLRVQDDLHRKIADRNEELEKLRSEVSNEVVRCNANLIEEKRRLKEEMKLKLKEFKANMLKMTDDQVESVRTSIGLKGRRALCETLSLSPCLSLYFV